MKSAILCLFLAIFCFAATAQIKKPAAKKNVAHYTASKKKKAVHFEKPVVANEEDVPPPPMEINVGSDLNSAVPDQGIPEQARGAGVYTYVEEMPEFNGDIVSWLQKNLVYPQDAKDQNLEGRVYVKFIVDKTGKVRQASIIRGVAPPLDKAALEVVNKMPDWKPGRMQGKPVDVYFTLPVVFKLQ